MANEIWDVNALSWTAINAGTTTVANTDIIPDGTMVYVEGIVNTGQKNVNYKIGEGGSVQYQDLPYKLPVYIEISADTDLTSAGLGINGNRLEVYNTDTSSHTVALNGSTSVVIGAGNKQFVEYNDGWISDIIFLTATNNYTITNKSRKVFLTFTRQTTDKSITLKSASSSIGQEFIIIVEGAATGNVYLIGNNVNDITATNWIWHGTGLLKIESNGSTYNALNDTWDTYETATELIIKKTNKEMTQNLLRTVTEAIATGTGPYWSAAIPAVSRTVNFTDVYSETLDIYNSSPSNNLVWLSFNATVSPNIQYKGFFLMEVVSTASQDYTINYSTKGLWVS